MLQTYEATVDQKGNIRLIKTGRFASGHRVLVTVLEEPALDIAETALLSEAALAQAWNQPEEDAAWAHLQQAQSS